MNRFFRYPQTPHLTWLGTAPPRGDKVLPLAKAEEILEGVVTVEEKLDGANLGISVNDEGALTFQNRGQYLDPPFLGQFARLTGWSTQHRQVLESMLNPGIILFGEWLAARHSVVYNCLPDWFVAFDVYDLAEGKFWSTSRRDVFVEMSGLALPPCITRRRTNLASLERLVMRSQSKFGDMAVEGLVIRRDRGQFNELRAKLVRPDFTQAISVHWRSKPLVWNKLMSA
jgi:hypothetical protein